MDSYQIRKALEQKYIQHCKERKRVLIRADKNSKNLTNKSIIIKNINNKEIATTKT